MALIEKAMPIRGGGLNFNIVNGLNMPPPMNSNNLAYCIIPNGTELNGITITVNEDGSITLNGTAISTSRIPFKVFNEKLETNSTYYTKTTSSSMGYTYGLYNKETHELESFPGVEIIGGSDSITRWSGDIPDDCYLGLGLVTRSGTEYVDETFYVQVTYDSNASYTRPEWKENTIWVKTEIPIRDWCMSKTEPENQSIGNIWFMEEDFERSVSFEMLKNNKTKTRIHTAKQWNGTLWETKESYIYQNKKWIEIPRIFRLFPTDYSCNPNNWVASSKTGSVVISSVSIWLYGHSEGSYRYLKGQPVEMSKYKTVNFFLDCQSQGSYNNNDFYFRWRSLADNTVGLSSKIDEIPESERLGINSLPIGDLTGEYYLDLTFSNGGGGVITDIWFEE